MSDKVATILEQIKGLTLLEAAQLVKEMESAFGVSAAAPVMMAGGGAAPAGKGPRKNKFARFGGTLTEPTARWAASRTCAALTSSL